MINIENIKLEVLEEFKGYKNVDLTQDENEPWVPKMALYKERGLSEVGAKTYTMLIVYDYPKIKKELINKLNTQVNIIKSIKMLDLISLDYLSSSQSYKGSELEKIIDKNVFYGGERFEIDSNVLYNTHYKIADFYEACKDKMGKEKAEMLVTLIFFIKVNSECLVHSWEFGKYYYRLGIIFDLETRELFESMWKELNELAVGLNKEQTAIIKKKHYNFLNTACSDKADSNNIDLDEIGNNLKWYQFEEKSVFIEDYKLFRIITDIDVISVWLGFFGKLPIYITQPEDIKEKIKRLTSE